MRRSAPRAPFVLTVTAAVAVATPVACGGEAFSGSGGAGSSGAGGTAGSGGSGAVGASGGSSGTAGTGPGGSGGAGGGVGGAAGSAGSVGSGGSAGAGCPTIVPVNGTLCADPGLVCEYPSGPCCPPAQAYCGDDGRWSLAIATCNPPPPLPCPSSPPLDGAPCGPADPCGSGQSQGCWGTCPDRSPETHGWCDGGTWRIERLCADDCSREARALEDFADLHRACVVDSDCTTMLGPCADGADFCDGTFYVNRSTSPDEFAALSKSHLDCVSRNGLGCAVCDAIAPPPACIAGSCGGRY